jgi:hypothetical protein
MLIKYWYINMMYGETPIYLRMGVLAPVTNFAGLSATLNETQRKAAINATFKSGRKLEDWLEMQPQRFVSRGINLDSYNAVVWVTP